MNYTVLIFLLVLWIGQYVFAYLDGTLFPGQMQKKFPNQSVLPLVYHGGIWFDFVLTIWLAQLVELHEAQWNEHQMLLVSASIVALAASIAMHIMYAAATDPEKAGGAIFTQEAHATNGDLTWAGVFHQGYMATAIVILLLEAFATGPRTAAELLVTAGMITILLFVGNHMVLGLVNKRWPTCYQGDPLHNVGGRRQVIWGTVAAWVIVVVRLTIY